MAEKAKDKVTVLLMAVGDAPILRQKKFNVDSTKTMAWFSDVIRKMIQLPAEQSLFFYVSQTFAPSPDHTFQVLRDCYSVASGKGDGENHVVLHYSITHAWG